MAGDMGKPDPTEQDRAYMEGPARPLEQFGSVFMTNSKWLNSAKMRDVYAQEGLRRAGHDVPPTYMVHQAAQTIAELSDEADTIRMIEAEKTLKPLFGAWLDKRSLSDFTLDELRDYAPGTLGGVVHDYLSRTGFDLNHSKRGLQPTSDYAFLQKQRVVSHDIEHIVSGLGPNPVGEQALIALNLKTYFDFFTPALAGELMRMSAFLLSTGIMKANLHYPRVMAAFLEGVALGSAIGEKMKHPLLLADWRGYLDWTIDDIRADLNIVGAPPQGTWDWTNDARRG